jgi:hypothetical protein
MMILSTKSIYPMSLRLTAKSISTYKLYMRSAGVAGEHSLVLVHSRVCNKQELVDFYVCKIDSELVVYDGH